MSTEPWCAGRLYDSTNAEGVPSLGSADLAAGYVAGKWPSYAALSDRFPGRTLSIDPTGSHPDADVLDVERGDARVSGIVPWLGSHNNLREKPGIIYVSLASFTRARDQLGTGGALWWVADWTGQAHLPEGADLCQFSSGVACDVSVFTPRLVEALGLPVSPEFEVAPPAASSPLIGGFAMSHGGPPVFNSLARDRQDDFFATLRVLWAQYRTDPITTADQNLYYLALELPITSPGSLGGSMDLVVAHLIDDARKKGVLRDFYASGAV